jgi:hypothetical protein
VPTTLVGTLVLLAALLVSPLVLAPRAEAFIYWTNYSAIARASLDGSGVDQSFITDVGYPAAIAVNFSLGKLKKDKERGTAQPTVEVPAPGDVALVQTKNLKGAGLRAEAAGEVQLPIKPQGGAKEKLAHKGKAKVKAEVTYTPDGGEPEAQIATLRVKR